MKNIYDLTPTDSRKSFYGKARVEIDTEEKSRTLYSYDTKILTIYEDGRIVKHWDGWSQTTGRHIKAFCEMDKKQFENLKN